MNVTLRQLEVFVATARLGTVTRAAADLALTQSAASTALSELERALGAPLFDRVGRRLVLNQTGATTLPFAERALSEAASVALAARGAHEGLIGRVRIGASTTIGNYVLPQRLGQIVIDNAGLDLAIRIGSTADVVDWVATRAVDFGLVEGPFARRGVTAVPWLNDEIVVVASPSRAEQVAREGLQGARWIVREPGSGTRLVVESALAEAGLTPGSTVEVGSTEAVKRFAQAGAGVAAISRRAVRAELSAGELREVEFSRRITRMFTVATTTGATPGGAAGELLERLTGE